MKITDKDILFADWLEGKITDEELKKQLSNEEYIQFLKLRSSFDLLRQVEQRKKKIHSNLETYINNNPSKVRNLQPKRIIKMAFASIAAVLILFLFIKISNGDSQIRFRNETASNQQIILPDSSQVILYANSMLIYDKKNWKKKREVKLQGKAYFIVKKGKAFKVKADQGEVMVLGTQFEVESSKERFQVICYEGKVKVITKKENPIILTPGKGILLTNNQLQTIESIWAQPEWLNHIYTYKKQKLGDVLNELSKIYDIRINTKNIDTKILTTGGFPKNNLDISLQTVLKPLDIGYQKKGNEIDLFYQE